MNDIALLGPFEEIVLLSLIRLGDDAYGMRIRRDVEARSGRSISIGAVYSALDRLEAKGYVVLSEAKRWRGAPGRSRELAGRWGRAP